MNESKDVRKWNGRDILCNFDERVEGAEQIRYDCFLTLDVDTKKYYGSSYWKGDRCANSFPSREEAFQIAIQNLENNIIKTAQGFYVGGAEMAIERAHRDLDRAHERQNLAKWLMEKFSL